MVASSSFGSGFFCFCSERRFLAATFYLDCFLRFMSRHRHKRMRGVGSQAASHKKPSLPRCLRLTSPVGTDVVQSDTFLSRLGSINRRKSETCWSICAALFFLGLSSLAAEEGVGLLQSMYLGLFLTSDLASRQPGHASDGRSPPQGWSHLMSGRFSCWLRSASGVFGTVRIGLFCLSL